MTTAMLAESASTRRAGRRAMPGCVRGMVLVMLALSALVLSGCRQSAPDPENELPFGVVEVPRPESVLRPGPTTVGGWALDDGGVREIRVYFDGRFKASTTAGIARPDVVSAWPRYAKAGEKSGWNVRVDFGMAPGPHTILVQAVDSHGATRDIGVVPVTTPR